MKKIWDKMGIAFSTACVVHCIIVAFLPLVFPVLNVYTHQGWVHMAVGSIILFTSPLAFVPGLKKHGLSWIVKVAVSGLFFILFAIVLEGRVSDQISHGLSIFGSLLLVFAHAKNLHHSHKHHKHHPHCQHC